MNRTIFLIVGQNWDYDMSPKGRTLDEIIEYFTTHNMRHEKGLELYQSDTGEYGAGWGRIVYKLVDGIFESHSSNVDSSD